MASQSQIRVKNLVQLMEKKTSRKKEIQTEHELRIQAKYIHLVTAMTHVDEMSIEMHRDQKLTDQELESIQQFQSVPIRAKEELLNIVMKKPREVYDAFLSALNNTKQQHIVQMLVSEVSVAPTEAKHPGLISRWYKWLVDNLNTDTELIIALYRSEVLTRREREQLDCQKNRTLKNELLLAMISRKTSDEFQLFKDVLGESNQTEVAKKLDKEMNMRSGSISEEHPTSPTVDHRHGVRTTPAAAKPSPLSPKPQLPPRPKVMAMTNAWPPKDQKLRSPSEVLSPKSPRSTARLERQISQPSSPAATDISLKVASIRQNITDVKDEIGKKKSNYESVHSKTDRTEEHKLKDSSRRGSRVAQEVVEEPKKGTEATNINIHTVTNAKENYSLQQRRLSMTETKENESLRRELEAANKRLQFLESSTENLRHEHDAQIKEFEKQLKNVSNKCEEQLKSSRSDLEKETKRRYEAENQLRSANNGIANLQHELTKEKKTKETNKGLENNDSKSIEVDKEHQHRQEVNETLQELNVERRTRIEAEKLKTDADRQLVELSMQLKEREKELENYKEKNKTILQDLSKETLLRTEQEQHLKEKTQKLLELKEHMEAEKHEQNHHQEEIQNVLQELSNEKRLRIEKEEHLTETKEKLLELQKQMESNEFELKSLREENKSVFQDLGREKILRLEQEQKLTEPRDDLLEIGKQVVAKEQELSNLKEEVAAISLDLSNVKRLRTENEQQVKETKDRLLEIGDELEAKERELKKLREENKTILQDMSKEKQSRMAQEQHLTEPTGEFLELRSEIEAKDEELSNLKEKMATILDDLNSEKRLRMEQELHLSDANDRLLELGKKMEGKELELENLKDKNKTTLQDLSNEKHLRIELEQHMMTQPRDKSQELGKRLEAKEQELEHLKEENKTIVEDLNKEKTLRMEREQHFSQAEEQYLKDTKEKFVEFAEQMESKDRELKYYQSERSNLLQDLSNEKHQSMDMENRLRETTAKLLELGKQTEALAQNNEHHEKEINDMLQHLVNEKHINAELNQLLSETREKLVGAVKQMEAKEQILVYHEEEKRAMHEELRNERRVRMETDRLRNEANQRLLELNEANQRLIELNTQMQARENELKTRREAVYDERRVIIPTRPTSKIIEQRQEQANEQQQSAGNQVSFMQELKNKQQKKVAQEKRVSLAAAEESDSSGDDESVTKAREAEQRRRSSNYQEPESESLQNNKDQLKKSLEQLFARAVKDSFDQQPKGDDQQRNHNDDDHGPVDMNSSNSLFPESLTRQVQLAPNLHMVRDRPNPHKNHLIRSHAGVLARSPDILSIDDEELV